MTIELSKEIEQSLEAYLAEKGLERDAMSEVVEEAVETFLFRQTFKEAHTRNAHLDPEEVEALVEDEVRKHRQRRLRR